MNLTKKNVTVRFFELKAKEDIINKFIGLFKALMKLNAGTDIASSNQERYIIKCIDSKDKTVNNRELLFWSSIKERNTWQVRSTQHGTITGLDDSNSIVGDITYYKFDPINKIIAAFTTYSSSTYLKSMCNTIFKRLLTKSADFTIDYLSDDIGVSQIKKWDYYSKISIKLNAEKIERSDEMPELIKALVDIKEAFGGRKISVTLDGGDEKLPKQDVTETVNYLAFSEGCSSLILTGGMFDEEEKLLPINLKSAFVKYKTMIELGINQRYIDSQQGSKVLSEAFRSTCFAESVGK